MSTTKRGRRIVDMTGQTYGRLTVKERAEPPEHVLSDPYRNQSWWRCECACSAVTVAPRRNLMGGSVRSCGCLKRDVIAARKHAA